MPTRKLTDVTQIVKQMMARSQRDQPARAIIHAVDGNRVDIRIPGSPGVMRHVEVVGNIEDLRVEDSVMIQWDHGRPQVTAAVPKTTEVKDFKESIPVDNVTLEYGPNGLRIKLGGINLSHLSFDPLIKKPE